MCIWFTVLDYSPLCVKVTVLETAGHIIPTVKNRENLIHSSVCWLLASLLLSYKLKIGSWIFLHQLTNKIISLRLCDKLT